MAEPKKAEYERACRCGCGERFRTPWHFKEFIDDSHKARYHNRRARYGARLFDAAITWRRDRKRGDFTKMCAVLDQIIAEERDAGR